MGFKLVKLFLMSIPKTDKRFCINKRPMGKSFLLNLKVLDAAAVNKPTNPIVRAMYVMAMEFVSPIVSKIALTKINFLLK